MDTLHEVLAVGEIAAQEPDQRIARHGLVGRIHRHLAEKVFRIRIQHDQRPEAVPKVIQRVDALGVAARLVGGLHERASQLDGAGQVPATKLVAETEIVFGREVAGIFVRTDDETVASDDLPGRRIPDDQLVIPVLGQVFGIDIHLPARTAAGAAERDLAQPSDFTHQRRALRRREDIDLVPGLLRVARFALGRKLGAEQFPVDGRYDRFHFSCLHNLGQKYRFTRYFPPGGAYFPKNTLFYVRSPPGRGGRRSVAARRRGWGRPRGCGNACPSAKTSRRTTTASRY